MYNEHNNRRSQHGIIYFLETLFPKDKNYKGKILSPFCLCCLLIFLPNSTLDLIIFTLQIQVIRKDVNYIFSSSSLSPKAPNSSHI